mgnify:FL=1
MNKEELSILVSKGFSTYDIGKKLKCSQTNVCYWLKKYGLTTVKSSHVKRCPRCKTSKSPNEFYNRRGKIGGSVYCKPCTNAQTLERTQAFKALAVAYKGGKCTKCGYSKCLGALEFHHLDPSQKDFEIGGLKLHAWSDVVKRELDKCILVCSNCHKEIHYRLMPIFALSRPGSSSG